MSSQFNRKDNYYTFSCDEPGCHANYETETGEFRSGWKRAQAEGWAYVPKYEDGVGRACHYCPEHAKQFDRPRGG